MSTMEDSGGQRWSKGPSGAMERVPRKTSVDVKRLIDRGLIREVKP